MKTFSQGFGGCVEYVSPTAAELPDTRERDRKNAREHVMPPSGYRALVGG